MKKLESAAAKSSKPKKLNTKAYTPHHIEGVEQQEVAQENIDASLEAAIEKVTETVTEEAPTQQGTKTAQQANHTGLSPQQTRIQEEIKYTKSTTLSTDNQGLESILPNIILPSKLQKLYEQEALLHSTKK